jgi:hypothetical protein
MKSDRIWPALAALFLTLTAACRLGGPAAPPSPTPITALIPTRSLPSPVAWPNAVAWQSAAGETLTPSASPVTPAATTLPPTPTTPPPTRTPSPPPPGPLPGPPPDTGPEIVYFTAEPLTVAPGGSVTLSWETRGSNAVTIQSWHPADLPGEFTQAAPAGRLDIPIAANERYWRTFTLVVQDDLGRTVETSLTVTLSCPYPFFFPFTPSAPWDQCPAGPAVTVAAAVQPFEGGWMLWLAESPGTGGPGIWALYADGTYRYYDDTWTPDDPADDPGPEPPPDRYRPIRGFGKIWANHVEVRERLGWATAPEQSFLSTYQERWMPYYLTNGVFLSMEDGRIIHLDRMPVWGFAD